MHTGFRSAGWLACGCFCLLAAPVFAQPGEPDPASHFHYFPVPLEARRPGPESHRPRQTGIPRLPRPHSASAVDQSPEHRINHLLNAAENLELAGFGEEAGELRERAARLEQELRRSQPSSDPLQEELRQLRQSVDMLRTEVHYLRHQLQTLLTAREAPGVSQEDPGVRPHEARIRLPDRKEPISDEELDQPVKHDLKGPAREKPRLRKQDSSASSETDPDMEFELVPVPYPESSHGKEPVPTPASRSPQPNQ